MEQHDRGFREAGCLEDISGGSRPWQKEFGEVFECGILQRSVAQELNDKGSDEK